MSEQQAGDALVKKLKKSKKPKENEDEKLPPIPPPRSDGRSRRPHGRRQAHARRGQPTRGKTQAQR